MVSGILSRVVILVFGTLYPAYASYKAVKTKDVKEYVKWMMYWIVFAIFTTVETFADVLISWFPFYYELKIVFVVWLLSPATKGSSVLYRKFVHPELLKREQEIDLTLDKVKSQGYSALVNVGQQGLNFAVQSAMTGQTKMMDSLMKKSFSMSDISQRQANSVPVTFKPANDHIAEERDEPVRDEPDFPSRDVLHVPSAPLLDVDSMQGGDLSQHKLGPNLKSHEYHGEHELPTSNESQPYNHNEGYHYGTLPRRSARRSASMRSNVNTALPSRWQKSAQQ